MNTGDELQREHEAAARASRACMKQAGDEQDEAGGVKTSQVKPSREVTSCEFAAITSCKSESQEGKGRDLRVETSAHPTGRQTSMSDLELSPQNVEGEAAARRTRMGWSERALEWRSEGAS